MNVTVRLFATFRTGRFGTEKKDYASGTTVGSIIEELSIPVNEIGATLINGRHVEKDMEVAEGDTVSIFPLVGMG